MLKCNRSSISTHTDTHLYKNPNHHPKQKMGIIKTLTKRPKKINLIVSYFSSGPKIVLIPFRSNKRPILSAPTKTAALTIPIIPISTSSTIPKQTPFQSTNHMEDIVKLLQSINLSRVLPVLQRIVAVLVGKTTATVITTRVCPALRTSQLY